jgi:hypothetical protein
MANRDARFIPIKTAVSGKIPTGTTGNELNFIKTGEFAINLTDRKLFSFDGTNVFEFGTKTFVNKSGGTVSGNLEVTGNLSGATLFSGSTNLEDIISSIASASDTYATGGTYSSDTLTININDGGSFNVTLPFTTKANLSGATFTGPVYGQSISATTISATTLYSGTTDLSDLFIAAGTDLGEDNTASNIGTGDVELFKQKTGVDLEFRTLSGGTGISISTGDTHVFSVDTIKRSKFVNDEQIFVDTAGRSFLSATITSFVSFAGSGQNDEAGFSMKIPQDYSADGEFAVWYSTDGTNGGDQWKLAFGVTSGNTGTTNVHTAADETVNIIASGYTGTAWRILRTDYFGLTDSYNPGEYLHVHMLRDPSDGADLMTDTLFVSEVEFRYTAKR